MQRALSLLNQNQQSFGGPKKSKGSDDDEYEVEEIVSAEKRGGRMMYEIKWKGYDNTTWQPKADLKHCKALLKDYMDSEGISAARRDGEGQMEFLVKLKGITEKEWQPKANVPDALVDAFRARKRPRQDDPRETHPKSARKDTPGARPEVAGHAQSSTRPITTSSTIQTTSASQEISVSRVGKDYLVDVGRRQLSLKEYLNQDAMNLFVFFLNDSDQGVQVGIRTHTRRDYEVILYTTNPVTIIASYNIAHQVICASRSFGDVLKDYCRLYKQISFKEGGHVSDNVSMRPGDIGSQHTFPFAFLFAKSLDEMLVTKAVVVMTIKNCLSQNSQIWRLDAIDDEHFLWSQRTDKLRTDDNVNRSHGARDKGKMELYKQQLQHRRAIAQAENKLQSVTDITREITDLQDKIDSDRTPPIHIPWRTYTDQFLTNKSTEPKLDLHAYELEHPPEDSIDQTICAAFKFISLRGQRFAIRWVKTSIDWLVKNEYARNAGSNNVFMKTSVSVTNMYKEGKTTSFALERKQDVGSSSSSRRPSVLNYHGIPIECIPANKIFMYFMREGHLYDVVERRKGTSFEDVVVRAKVDHSADVRYTYKFSNSIISNDTVKTSVQSIVDLVGATKKPIMDAIAARNLDEVVRFLDVERIGLIHAPALSPRLISLLKHLESTIYVPVTFMAEKQDKSIEINTKKLEGAHYLSDDDVQIDEERKEKVQPRTTVELSDDDDPQAGPSVVKHDPEIIDLIDSD